MEVFSKRLKSLREGNRYSQKELSDILGISQSYYAKFELDQGEPNLITLVKIADLFEVSIDFLLGRMAEDESSYLPRTNRMMEDLLKRLDAVETVVYKSKNKGAQ